MNDKKDKEPKKTRPPNLGGSSADNILNESVDDVLVDSNEAKKVLNGSGVSPENTDATIVGETLLTDSAFATVSGGDVLAASQSAFMVIPAEEEGSGTDLTVAAASIIDGKISKTQEELESALLMEESAEEIVVDERSGQKRILKAGRNWRSLSIKPGPGQKKAQSRLSATLKASNASSGSYFWQGFLLVVAFILGMMAYGVYAKGSQDREIAAAKKIVEQAEARARELERDKKNQQDLISEKEGDNRKILTEKETAEKKLQETISRLEGFQASTEKMVENLRTELSSAKGDAARAEQEKDYLEKVTKFYTFRVVSSEKSGFPEAILYTAPQIGTIAVCPVLESHNSKFQPFIRGPINLLSVVGGSKEDLKDKLAARKKTDLAKFMLLLEAKKKENKDLQERYNSIYNTFVKIIVGSGNDNNFAAFEAQTDAQSKFLSDLSFFGEDALLLFVRLALYNKALRELIPYGE